MLQWQRAHTHPNSLCVGTKEGSCEQVSVCKSPAEFTVTLAMSQVGSNHDNQACAYSAVSEGSRGLGGKETQVAHCM